MCVTRRHHVRRRVVSRVRSSVWRCRSSRETGRDGTEVLRTSEVLALQKNQSVALLCCWGVGAPPSSHFLATNQSEPLCSCVCAILVHAGSAARTHAEASFAAATASASAAASASAKKEGLPWPPLLDRQL